MFLILQQRTNRPGCGSAPYLWVFVLPLQPQTPGSEASGQPGGSGGTSPTLPSFLSWVPVLPAWGDGVEQSKKFPAAAAGLPWRMSFSALLTNLLAPLQFPFLGGGCCWVVWEVVAVEQNWGFSVLQSRWVAVLYGHSYRAALQMLFSGFEQGLHVPLDPAHGLCIGWCASTQK